MNEINKAQSFALKHFVKLEYEMKYESSLEERASIDAH